MSRKSRELTAEELALWQFVTRSVKRATPRGLATVMPATDETPHAAVQPIAKASVVRPPHTPRALVLGADDGIDRRTAQRFAKGEMKIDARLDLHGMSLSQAESAVTHFVQSSAAAGHRCLIVVTGKGRRGDHRTSDFDLDGRARGRIRMEAPHWLNRPSLRPLILAVREAHFRHGGGGALYVLLKRRR